MERGALHGRLFFIFKGLLGIGNVKPGIPQRRRGPHFTLLFVLAMLLCALATFIAFTAYARSSIAARREANRAHLRALGEALNAYARSPGGGGNYPADPRLLYPAFLNDASVSINPSWPEQAGYLYVCGAKPGDGPETVLIAENVPPSKAKLGRLVLTGAGEVLSLSQSEYEQRLHAQAARWKDLKRPWKVVEVERFE